MGRLVKFLWFLSLVIGLAALLYTYASMGSQLEFGEYNFSKEAYFYGALAVLVLFNFTFYAVSRNLRYSSKHLEEMMVNWQLSFAAILNLFFIVSVFFVMLVNGGENFNFDNFGYLLYVCLGLILIWVLALPVLIGRAAVRK
jgi:hypothetical protein